MNEESKKTIQELADKAVAEEKALEAVKSEFAIQNAEFAAFLKTQAESQKAVDKMWNDVKNALVAAGYTDVIENDNFRVSVSKVLGIKVVDLDKLEAFNDDYVETVKVAKSDKLKKHYELYGTLPDGTIDNSFYRLNKKVK